VGVRKSRSVTKRTLLIDADIIAYEFSNRGQRVYEWGDDEASVALDDIGEITPGIEQRFQTWMEDLEADDMIVCLTPSPDDNNFRKKLAPYYKGNRKGIAKPLLHEPVRQWLDSRYRTFMRDGLEADDCMGILSTHPTLVPGEKVIVSGDKDMQTIPGRLFNPNKTRLREISVAEADYHHMLQTLTGDQVDNYPGLRGIGPVKAEKVLDGLPVRGIKYSKEVLDLDLWGRVVNAYVGKDLTEDDALLQARLARILRHTDYDFKRKAPILWQPPGK
jgi:DNA polymerase-1